MLMHIFVGSVHMYSSKMVFGHSKSIIATRDGSMALSLIPSGSILNVASSTRIEIDVIMSFRSLASAILSLNMGCYLSTGYYRSAIKDFRRLVDHAVVDVCVLGVCLFLSFLYGDEVAFL